MTQQHRQNLRCTVQLCAKLRCVDSKFFSQQHWLVNFGMTIVSRDAALPQLYHTCLQSSLMVLLLLCGVLSVALWD